MRLRSRWGIREHVTLSCAVMVAIAMAALAPVVAFGARQSAYASTEAFLVDRLEVAAAQVARGDLSDAVDVVGPVAIQVLGADGEVAAASVEALSKQPVLDDDALEEMLEKVADALEDAAEGSGERDEARQDVASGQAAGVPVGVSRDERSDDPYDDDEEEWDDDIDGQDDVEDAGGYGWYGVDADDGDDVEDLDWDDDDAEDWDDDDDGAKSLVHVGTRRAAQAMAFLASLMDFGDEIDGTVARALEEYSSFEGPYLVRWRDVGKGSESYRIVGIASLANAVEAMGRSLKIMALVSVLAVAASLALTWHLVGKTLRPVEQMRSAAEAMASVEPGQRIPVPANDRDLQGLAITLNDLLARAQQSLVEERRFVSDASHQLKSPVAAQRIMIDALRQHPDDVDRDETLNDLARENARLQGIVEDLLALARHDEGFKPTRVPVDLIDVIFENAAAVQEVATVPLEMDGVEPVVALGDARLLGQAVRNLLDNAVRYARTRVWVTCREEAGSALIEVSDDGPGIPPADRERVFERFVRLEQPADVSASSTGLGLAVVRSIVAAHGGTVHFEKSSLGGARAIMTLPLGL